MTKILEDQAFYDFYDRDSAGVFEDLEFRRCVFVSSRISMTRNPSLRSTVRNIKIVNCEQRGCALEAAILEDVLVDGLKTNGVLRCWAAGFKHAVLRGKIGRILISSAVATGTATPEQQRAFDEANAAYYKSVDWALDISEAEFEECDIRRVPAHLIRRDPETQVVVKREKAMLGKWRELDLSKAYWAGWLDLFLKDGDSDIVLVAPKRHKKFRQLLDGLKLLRDAGVAELD